MSISDKPAHDLDSSDSLQSKRRWLIVVCLGVLFFGTAIVALYVYRARLIADGEALSIAPVGHRKNAPYIPSPQDVVDLMLEVSDIDSDDVVFDLGCGDGRIIVTAAKQFGCRCVGYEYDKELAELARENAKKAGVDHLVTIHQMDIFNISDEELNQASIITLYLLDWMNAKLIPQLRALDDGKTIVSHDWGLKQITPDRTVQIKSVDDPEGKEHVVHVWSTPLARE